MTHIIHQDGHERESVATHRLLATPPLRDHFFRGMGLSWFIMELQFSTLGLDQHGEIDIIGGILAPENPAAYQALYDAEALRWPGAPPEFLSQQATRLYAPAGGLGWPPRTDFLVGVEVKCAYEQDGAIKSAKDSPKHLRKLHKQLKRDRDLGLDYVLLLDIIANEPVSGDGNDPWWGASNTSFTSFQVMRPTLDQRLPEDSPIGHWAWSVGAIDGRDERFAGAGGPRLLREPVKNPRTPRRARVEGLLATLLSTVPRPRTFPVLLKDCRRCGTVHLFDEFSDDHECTPENTLI